jgi:hypothetical protein
MNWLEYCSLAKKHRLMSKPKMCLLWQKMQCLRGAFPFVLLCLQGSWGLDDPIFARHLAVCLFLVVKWKGPIISPCTQLGKFWATWKNTIPILWPLDLVSASVLFGTPKISTLTTKIGYEHTDKNDIGSAICGSAIKLKPIPWQRLNSRQFVDLVSKKNLKNIKDAF